MVKTVTEMVLLNARKCDFSQFQGLNTLYNVCAVPWGDIMSTVGGYHEYRGDIMSTVGDILSTVEGVQYRGGLS